jgi:hypothetical protein
VHGSALTDIFTAFSNDILIQGNESDHNGEHGIYQSNSSTHPTIRGNLSYHNASAGIHMNGDISEQPGNGLVLYATVESNVIWENGARGGLGINCDGVDDSIFRNNLLYNKVYNNTIVMAPNSRFIINIPNDGGGKAPPAGNVIENNILYTPDSFQGYREAGGARFSQRLQRRGELFFRRQREQLHWRGKVAGARLRRALNRRNASPIICGSRAPELSIEARFSGY